MCQNLPTWPRPKHGSAGAALSRQPPPPAARVRRASRPARDDPPPGHPPRLRRRGRGLRPRRLARGERRHGCRPRRRRSTGRPSRPATSSTTTLNGFNPTEILRDFDYGQDDAPARRPGPARVGAGRPGQGDRGRSRRHATRPGPTTAASRARPCAAPRASCCGSASSTAPTHPHTIHFHGFHPAEMDGVPGVGAGRDRARREHDLRVRRRAVRTAPLPLPRQPARRAHRPRPVRRLHHRPAGRAGRTPTSMVMVMNGFNTNFDAEGNQVYAVNTVAFHYNNEPIRVKPRRARADLPGEHPRVRPDQLVPHPRATSSTTSRRGRRWSRASSPTR